MPRRVRAALVMTTLLAGAPRPTRADDFDLRDTDKQAHVAVSYGITLSVAAVLRRYDVPRWQAVALGVAATAVLGTAKELLDPPYEWGDQLANAIGSGGAAIVVFSFQL